LIAGLHTATFAQANKSESVMNDPIYGSPGSDSLNGGGGDDIIYGGAGNDYIGGGRGADKLYGQAGDDTISVALRGGGRLIADGGSGNDSLYARNGGGPNQSVTFIGGDGNDTIGLDGFALDNIINAGRGNDTVFLGSTLGAIVILGDGADKLALGSGFNPHADAIIVNDYKPGTDQFDPNFDGNLYGWDGTSNPFSGGFVRLLASGKDTLLQFDPNGGGDAFVTEVRFKNIAPSAFTAADFGGWPTDGSSPAAKTIAGAARADTVKGMVQADSLHGGTGAAADAFAFSTTLGLANVDTAIDFASADGNWLSLRPIYANGILAEDAILAHAAALAAHEASDRIIYDTITRSLHYYADSNRPAETFTSALLEGAPTLPPAEIALFA
jgi:Ca2+-binding RTX toxin-like protein